jgi:DNA helicase II / ATP-dependent DNA helicase PcrA
MAWNDGIDGIHVTIAADERSPLHVLAGPGTGKTTAMMRRIARLLESGARPEKVLAVTFTRTAARDLEQQLGSLKTPGAEKVGASTLHSLSFKVLVAEAVFQATGRRARPLLSHEIKQLVNDLKSGFGGKREVERLLEAYEAAWARFQAEEAGHPKTPEDEKFEIALLVWLRYHGAILIGELVPITLRFLLDNPQADVLPKYEHVLVDEYQDLNKADQTLVEALAVHGTLTVIGDDNQSIYSFRHANPEGIRTFPATHKATVEYVIDECRRCPPNVIQLSNSLIAHDPDARPAVMKPQPGRPEAIVHVVQHNTIADEADAIAAFINDYLKKHPDVPPGKVLVLSPRRLFGNAVKDALIKRKLNAQSFFWEDALSEDSAAEGFCLYALNRNIGDRAAYRTWLGLGEATGYSAGYKRVRPYSDKNNIEPHVTVQQIVDRTITIPYTDGIAKRHLELTVRLQALTGLTGLPLVDVLWPNTESNQVIRLVASPLALQIADADELFAALTESITRPELPDAEGDIVRVMSLHKSKGLTADLVVVVGCVAGAIPSIDTTLPKPIQDAVLKEQRRLFYVAITRARDTLVLSSIRQLPLATALQSGVIPMRITRQNGESIAIAAATPFLKELGKGLPATEAGPNWRARLGV